MDSNDSTELFRKLIVVIAIGDDVFIDWEEPEPGIASPEDAKSSLSISDGLSKFWHGLLYLLRHLSALNAGRRTVYVKAAGAYDRTTNTKIGRPSCFASGTLVFLRRVRRADASLIISADPSGGRSLSFGIFGRGQRARNSPPPGQSKRNEQKVFGAINLPAGMFFR